MARWKMRAFEAILHMVLLPLASSSSSSSTSLLSVSPVANWDPSWAASSAHGTTVVVSFDGGGNDVEATTTRDATELAATDPPSLSSSCDSRGCVILLRSPTAPPDYYNNADVVPTEDPAAGVNDASSDESAAPTMLPLRQWVDTRRLVLDRVTRRWAWLPPSTLVAMTGLASDVDYVLSSIMAEWDSRAVVYEDPDEPLGGWGMATAQQLLATTRDLAELLYGAAQSSDGGRPFGVQCLLVGPPMASESQNIKDIDESSVVRPPPTTIFTLDPGGGRRHWGVATAMGRAADKVRRNLHEEILSKGPGRRHLPQHAREALRVAMNATLSALGDDNDDGTTGAHYAALVVVHRGAGREALLGIVDPTHIQAVRKELVAEKASKGRAA